MRLQWIQAGATLRRGRVCEGRGTPAARSSSRQLPSPTPPCTTRIRSPTKAAKGNHSNRSEARPRTLPGRRPAGNHLLQAALNEVAPMRSDVLLNSWFPAYEVDALRVECFEREQQRHKGDLVLAAIDEVSIKYIRAQLDVARVLVGGRPKGREK